MKDRVTYAGPKDMGLEEMMEKAWHQRYELDAVPLSHPSILLERQPGMLPKREQQAQSEQIRATQKPTAETVIFQSTK